MSYMELHAIVKGRVQGVGFRFITQRLASTLGLKGFVKNLPEGDVEILAQGSNDALDQFIKHLKEEAFPNEISSIEQKLSHPQKNYHEFQIVK